MDEDVKRAICGQLSVPVVVAGKAFGLGRNASYRAVQVGEIEANRIGGKWSCPTAPIRKRLGIDDARAAS